MGEQVRTTVVALLIAGFSSTSIAVVNQPESTIDQWHAESSQHTLADSSVLTEYYGFTTATKLDNVLLRVGFVPRFDCSPLIGIVIQHESAFSGKPEEAPLPGLDVLADGDSLTLSIDGVPMKFPVAADGDKKQTRLWFDSAFEDRKALQSKFDLGNVAKLSLTSATSITFSLLGSKSILDGAQSLCHEHDPIPYEKPKNR
ncbi:MAG: hypothetical protein V3U76_11725 [Granulosicoccus sp.]